MPEEHHSLATDHHSDRNPWRRDDVTPAVDQLAQKLPGIVISQLKETERDQFANPSRSSSPRGFGGHHLPLRRMSSGLDSPGSVVHRLAPIDSSSGASTPDHYVTHSELGFKLVVVMVGLPARGKSYISKKLKRYLSWLGFNTRVFNVGNLRRKTARRQEELGKVAPNHSSAFFDSRNAEAKTIRDNLAMESLNELIHWLIYEGGKVGIHDATNSTVERRRMIRERCEQEPAIKVMFIESLCTDPQVIERNISMKLLSPDYQNYENKDRALQDFRNRLANYEKVYQTIGEEEEQQHISYCKMINVGAKVVACNIHGYLCGQAVFYLMNLNLNERQIWLSRHGETTDNVKGTVGGDASLTEAGIKYRKALVRFIDEERIRFIEQQEEKLRQREDMGFNTEQERGDMANRVTFNVWTSMLKRSVETVEEFDPLVYDVKHIRFLNEIYAGNMENLTKEEILQRYPNEYKTRQENKLHYRYPGSGGESYLDMVARLNPIIVEIERMKSSLLIVAHTVVMRTILAYMLDISLQDMTRIPIPLHTLFCIKPNPHGADLAVYRYNDTDERFYLIETPATFLRPSPAPPSPISFI